MTGCVPAPAGCAQSTQGSRHAVRLGQYSSPVDADQNRRYACDVGIVVDCSHSIVIVSTRPLPSVDPQITYSRYRQNISLYAFISCLLNHRISLLYGVSDCVFNTGRCCRSRTPSHNLQKQCTTLQRGTFDRNPLQRRDEFPYSQCGKLVRYRNERRNYHFKYYQ